MTFPVSAPTDDKTAQSMGFKDLEDYAAFEEGYAAGVKPDSQAALNEHSRVAFRVCSDFALAAPGEVKAAAVLAMARYMKGKKQGVSQESGDDKQAIFDPGVGAFRRSGAQALLAPYRRRTARGLGQ